MSGIGISRKHRQPRVTTTYRLELDKSTFGGLGQQLTRMYDPAVRSPATIAGSHAGELGTVVGNVHRESAAADDDSVKLAGNT
jgi:CO/xanthine dehydrogenase FAD-binding subunit